MDYGIGFYGFTTPEWFHHSLFLLTLPRGFTTHSRVYTSRVGLLLACVFTTPFCFYAFLLVLPLPSWFTLLRSFTTP